MVAWLASLTIVVRSITAVIGLFAFFKLHCMQQLCFVFQLSLQIWRSSLQETSIVKLGCVYERGNAHAVPALK
jgi:hypothetical protein